MDDKNPRLIQEAVEARRKAEQEALAAEEKKADPITPEFVRECFRANEMGDGTLFASLHKGRLIFNNINQKWYHWNGHHWDIDVLEKVFPLVENVVAKYQEEAVLLAEEEKKARLAENKDLAKKIQAIKEAYERRVKQLRGDRAQKCLNWSHRVENGLGIKGDEFDRNPWLLACANGILDLRTGHFRDGRPDDYLLKAVPHVWKGENEQAPAWEEFLAAVFEDNKEVIAFIQRLLGFSMTGITDPHTFVVFYGELARNGKGTLVETLQHIFGPLSRSIQSEMLLDQRFSRSSAGPTPDIMSLFGTRLAFASETDEGRRFAVGKIKGFSGGDRLVGRHPNDKYETNFEPTHLLFLLTNHLPHAPADDGGFWDRLQLIPFNVRFVDEPKKLNERKKIYGMAERLKAETPGILAWLVKGCISWQRQGLNPPKVIIDAKNKYKGDEDTLANFLLECCETPEETNPNEQEKLKDLYNAFTCWYEKNIGALKSCPKKQTFGKWMEKRGFKKIKAGDIYFIGVTLTTEEKNNLI